MTLLEMSAAGAVLVGAVCLLRCAVSRKLPKGAFVALWWVAALRLLTPFAPASRFSLYTLLESLRRVPAPAAAPVAPAAGTPVAILPIPVAVEPLPAAPQPFPVWTAVWLAGAAALGICFLWNYIRWRSRFREALPVSPNASAASCARVKVGQRVRVRVSDRISAPLTYGLLRPVVLLPKSMDLSDQEALDCVLAHEWVHIRRLDGLFKLVLAAAVCVHWFNPAAWVLFVLANRDMELRCDEGAIRTLGEDRRELYALTLIRLAECRSVPLCGFSRKSGMEERIIAIMNFKKKSALAWAAALLAVVCVTTVFATSAMKSSGKVNLPEPAPTAPAELSAEDDMAVLQALRDSVTFDNDVCSFTIPDVEGAWNIWISARIVTADGMGMSVHYLEEESERGEWVPGKTYYFTETERQVDELTMQIGFNDSVMTFDPLNPETVGAADFGSAEPPAELPAFKEDMPKGAAMIWPVDSTEISAGYSEGDRPHNGVDIGGLSEGDPIYAAASGTVQEVGFNAQEGNYVRLSHENGMTTFYAHCQTALVETGEAVEMGQTIAKVGKTGMATGPHLHFEIAADGKRIDPAGLLEAAKNRAEILAPLAAAAAENLENGQYPVNKNGQTYAPNEALTDTLGAPDLVGVIATNGAYGYVSLKDLNTNVQVAWGTRMSIMDPEAVEARSLPVYDEAGDVIGEFIVKAGKTAPAEPAPVEAPPAPVETAPAPAEMPAASSSFSQNDKGETYGTVLDIPAGSSTMPDLIAAVGTNGEHGYVSSTDWSLENSSDRETNLAFMNWVAENNVAGWLVPLYDKDHNVIGEFECGTSGEYVGGRVLSYEEVMEAKRNGWPNSRGSEPSDQKPRYASIEEAMAAAERGEI